MKIDLQRDLFPSKMPNRLRHFLGLRKKRLLLCSHVSRGGHSLAAKGCGSNTGGQVLSEGSGFDFQAEIFPVLAVLFVGSYSFQTTNQMRTFIFTTSGKGVDSWFSLFT